MSPESGTSPAPGGMLGRNCHVEGLGVAEIQQVRLGDTLQQPALGSRPGMPASASVCSRRDLDINRPGTVPNAKTLR